MYIASLACSKNGIIAVKKSMSITFSSTCSVAIVPELSDDASFEIPDSDLKFEFMRSSGAGGQNVNVTDSAVR